MRTPSSFEYGDLAFMRCFLTCIASALSLVSCAVERPSRLDATRGAAVAAEFGTTRGTFVVQDLGTGEMLRHISGGVDRFWLGSSLQISADEQVEFLRRLSLGELPVSKSSAATVLDMLEIESGDDYTLRGKTGGGRQPNGSTLGWLVGYLERDGAVYAYALNIDGPDFDSIRDRRMELVRGCFAALGLMPEAGAKSGLARDGSLLPNIVIVYTDDQGYGDVSALNKDSKFQTPNIDRLVHEGMTFTDGHCSDTVCTPSRYGLLTGRYSWRSRLKTGVMGAEGRCLIENGRVTLASLLREHGYSTAMIGKWHLGMRFDGKVGARDWTRPFTDGPIEKGFAHFFGIPASMNYGILTYLRQDRVLAPASLWTAKKPGENQGDEASYRIMPPYESVRSAGARGRSRALEVADDFVDSEVLQRFLAETGEWIGDIANDAKKGKPFFLYLSLTSPHKPVCPQETFRGKSKAGLYGDFMMETDHRVGQLLGFLDEHGLTENTMVIFTADNGPENTYRDRVRRYGHASSGPYRGGKRDLYEGGHRVPFIVRWPGHVEPGSRFGEPVCQTDLLATFAQMVGAELPANAGEDSFSLLRALRAGSQAEGGIEGAAVLSRGPLIHHSVAGMFAIRDGDWKLNLGRGPQGKSRPGDGEPIYELYNLAVDPGEKKNVIAENQAIAKRLERRITQLIQNGRSNPGPRQRNNVDWWPQLTWIRRGKRP